MTVTIIHIRGTIIHIIHIRFSWKEMDKNEEKFLSTLHLVRFLRNLFGISELSSYLCRKITNMHVISFASIRDYSRQHADATIALSDWHTKTERATWSTLADIKKTFGSADYVGNDRYVFL